ncbi:MAG: dihydropteroate synthase [Lachnospiraceae bacterium]|nr:dihydropteroate synthase [Lachnospiraceae bacterium]
MVIGGKNFDVQNETYVMGILNITPDSFSDGGKWMEMDAALAHTEEMIKEGATIIDVGGESTRPGYETVSVDEETARVCPVIEEIKKRFDIPISLDTCKSAVAEAGIKAGADMINDVYGFKFDEKLAQTVADSDVVYCLVHNRKEAVYKDFMNDVLSDIEESLEIAARAGIGYDRIIVDPGVGFGKTVEQNLELIGKLEEFHTFGLPLLLGTSRKSVIGETLDLPKDERLEGTLVTTAFAVAKKASFVRVHNVKENLRAVKMAKAILANS